MTRGWHALLRPQRKAVRARWIGAVALALLCRAAPVRGAFELPPPDGNGPWAGPARVVEEPSAAAVFAHPARIDRTPRLLLAGGMLYGMPELRRGTFAVSFPARAGCFALGASVLGDSLYAEERVAAGAAWDLARGVRLGVS